MGDPCVEPATQMHRPPDSAIPREDAGGDDDVADDQRDEQVGRPAMDPDQPDERRPAVQYRHGDAADDQGEQRDGECNVRQPLTGVELSLMPAEPPGEKRGRPAAKPGQIPR